VGWGRSLRSGGRCEDSGFIPSDVGATFEYGGMLVHSHLSHCPPPHPQGQVHSASWTAFPGGSSVPSWGDSARTFRGSLCPGCVGQLSHIGTYVHTRDACCVQVDGERPLLCVFSGSLDACGPGRRVSGGWLCGWGISWEGLLPTQDYSVCSSCVFMASYAACGVWAPELRCVHTHCAYS
jgi:hypothetical protein